MTNNSANGTISKMAIRPRIQVDVEPVLNNALDMKAAELSVKLHKRVSKREVVLLSLLNTYPELEPLILAELAMDPKEALRKLLGRESE